MVGKRGFTEKKVRDIVVPLLEKTLRDYFAAGSLEKMVQDVVVRLLPKPVGEYLKKGSMEEMVQEFIDREMIKELKHRYCWAVDRGTLEEVLALFDEECSVELIPGGREEGREAVRAWYDNYIRNVRMNLSRHQIHNQVIEVNGDMARARAYFDTAGEVKGVARVSAGFYEDTLVKKNGQWKFREVIIRMDWRVPLKEGWGGEKFIL